MTYNAGQFANLLPFIGFTPDYFILGGPADGDEAQCAVKQWKKVKVFGFEPHPRLFQWQLENGWPTPETLYQVALDRQEGVRWFSDLDDGSDVLQASRLSSLQDRGGQQLEVSCTTLDIFYKRENIRGKALLWLDIEGFEYQALKGANSLLKSGVVKLINVESLERDEPMPDAVCGLLSRYGYVHVGNWGNDSVYQLEKRK